MKPWIGVDLDRTLAVYDGWKGPFHIGEPIAPMVNRVIQWLYDGNVDVRIFTARAYVGRPSDYSTVEEFKKRLDENRQVIAAIEAWCEQHLGQKLPITCTKDFGMIELWDDRAVQMIPNTGARVDGNP